MSRNALRVLCSIVGILGGACCIFFLQGYVLTEPGMPHTGAELPMPYVGGLFMLSGILGLCGVNVFIGGPLDQRRDPPRAEREPEQ